MVEVIALHDHVVEFQEGQPLLHPLLITFCPQHIVHGEASTHFPQQLHIVQSQQPVGVVDHQGFAVGEVDEAGHLLLEALGVVVDVLRRQHLAHISLAGRVTDEGGAAAQQGDGLVAVGLETAHQAECHEVTHMEGISGGVEANIEGGLAAVDQFLYLFLIGDLGDQAAGDQFIIQCHRFFSPLITCSAGGRHQKTPSVHMGTEGAKIEPFCTVPPLMRQLLAERTSGSQKLRRNNGRNPTVPTGRTHLVPPPLGQQLRGVFTRRSHFLAPTGSSLRLTHIATLPLQRLLAAYSNPVFPVCQLDSCCFFDFVCSFPLPSAIRRRFSRWRPR